MKISTQSKRTDKQAIFSGIGIFSLSLFVAASAVYMYSPVAESHADTTGNSIVNLSVNSIISLSLNSNTVAMNADMNSFTHQSVTASVSSNSQFGYTLAIEDGDSDSSMTHTSSSITDKITSSFSGGKTSGEMDDNTWGYSISNSTYYKIPVAGSPVALKRTNAPLETETDDTVVDFGVKVGNITSGSYQDTVTLSAYVNGVDGTPSDGTSVDDPGDGTDSMQSFDCSSLANVNDSAVLTDTRDNSTYTVKKLADGKCWMTENLKISNTTITPDDSDVASNYTIPAQANITTWTSELRNSDGWNDLNQKHKVLDPQNGHGVYYNWYTVTAGSGTRTTAIGENAAYSICPKGWKLPTSGATNSDYSALITAYGGHYSTDIQGTPAFGLPGYVDGDAELWSVGLSGYYWGSTSVDDGYGHDGNGGALRISSTFTEMGRQKMYEGLPARCVAR